MMPLALNDSYELKSTPKAMVSCVNSMTTTKKLKTKTTQQLNIIYWYLCLLKFLLKIQIKHFSKHWTNQL